MKHLAFEKSLSKQLSKKCGKIMSKAIKQRTACKDHCKVRAAQKGTFARKWTTFLLQQS